MHRFKSGFTLVELLVVITIIGLLMAMLIPAVNTIRERGRQTACFNNQKQIGTAILAYETGQNHLPGLMDQMKITLATGGTAQVQYSWAEAIFPNIERADLWGFITSGNTNAVKGIRVSTMVCPDDPIMADPTSPNAQQLLSYGVCDEFFVDYRAKPLFNPTYAPPVGRHLGVLNTYSPAVVSNLKNRVTARGQTVTTTQSIMLGERTYPSAVNPSHQWGDPGSPNPGNWAGWNSSPLIFWNQLSFPWVVGPVPISPTVLASTHAAAGTGAGTVVVVTYFDGHSAILPSDTPFP